MIQIIGYMVAAYGVARLATIALASEEAPTKNRSAKTLIAAVGAGVLILLAVWLTQQADALGTLGS